MADRIQIRRGDTTAWNNANPVLEEGEIGLNTTLGQFKIGDGNTQWSDLDYYPSAASLDTSLGSYIQISEKGSVDGVATLDSTGKLTLDQVPDTLATISYVDTKAPLDSPTLTDPTILSPEILLGITNYTDNQYFSDWAWNYNVSMGVLSTFISYDVQTNSLSVQFIHSTGHGGLSVYAANNSGGTITNETLLSSGPALSLSSVGNLVTAVININSIGGTLNISNIQNIVFRVNLGSMAVTKPFSYNETLQYITISSSEILALDGIASNIQTQINSKASLSSPELTGTPTAPTATAGTNTTQIATTAFVKTALDNLIDGAPDALNTLYELAASLGNNENFSSLVVNALALKAPLTSPTFTGTVDFSSATVLGIDSGGTTNTFHPFAMIG